MEMTVRMPANYNVMSGEEMTYTTGGATAVEALCAWIVPFYGWYKACTDIRDYRRQNPNTWLESGLDHFANHMGSSITNMLYDIACASWFVSVCATVIGIVPSAFIIFS